jgi:[ribosomal protein S5]-alanine N-acetyltransferase
VSPRPPDGADALPPPPPRLSGAHVAVTLACDGDAPGLLSFHRRNREHLKPWSPPFSDGLFTMPYWAQWAAQSRPLYDHELAVRLVMRLRDETDGPVVGQINFSNIVRGPFQAAYLGYQIDAAHQGKGLMTEALRLAVGFMFDRYRLHRIMANYIPDNIRSARVLERLGFEREGYARDYLFIDGAWRDHVLTALVNPQPGPPAAAESAAARPAGPARPGRRLIARRDPPD